jgi:outer membrane lipopolysaccharide assembly protein LptE/RlpB
LTLHHTTTTGELEMPKPLHLNLNGVSVETDDGEIMQLLDLASEKLAELVTAITNTGKAGSLTMKIEIKPSTAGALAVRGDVKIKKPQRMPREALFWATPDGNLMADDPRQIKMELKTVPEQKTELKTVATA